MSDKTANHADDWDSDVDERTLVQDGLLRSSPLTSLASSPVGHPSTTPFTPTQAQQFVAPSSSGPAFSSPIVGSKAEKAAARKKKAAKLQSTRMSALHALRRAERTEIEAQPGLAADLDDETDDEDIGEPHLHATIFRHVFKLLHENGTNLGELFQYVANPAYGQHRQRFRLLTEPCMQLMLNMLETCGDVIRKNVLAWSVTRVIQGIQGEARTVTEQKIAQTHHRTLDSEFFKTSSLLRVKQTLQQLMPTSWSVFGALASNPKYAASHGEKRQQRRSNVVFTTIMQCMSQWSQKNNLMQKFMGLYMYAAGAQRQQIEVLSHMGITESYTSVVDKRKRKKSSPTVSVSVSMDIGIDDIERATDDSDSIRKGTLRQLSGNMHYSVQRVAATEKYLGIYDNINLNPQVAEQIIGRTNAQENGTCATVVALHGAETADMHAESLIHSFNNAPELQLTDIIHSQTENDEFRTFMIWTVLRIVILEGGEHFQQFRAELSDRQPATMDKIDVHKSEIYPTPAWKIDQSTITGNAEFINSFYDYLGVRTSPEFSIWVRLIVGDQLSIARLRSLLNIRAGQEGGAAGFRNFVLVPGLFHAKIADVNGFFATHWGKNTTANRVPGSLYYHNTILGRLPITPTSLPPFHTCRDLIWVSLYSRVLDCLLLVTGKRSLDDVKHSTFDDLLQHATEIYDRFVNIDEMHGLRSEREFATAAGQDPTDAKKGDMIYENAVLFLRDALISREFADAIKCGDSGRVVLVLKIWALSFRGNGRTKYAYEMLSLIHHLTSVWPKPIVKIVLNNWLVNTTGNINSFLECDLLQEHMNYWIKNFYRAHGSNTSWQWLEMVAPCVIVLRDLTRSLNGLLGADLGTKHKSPDRAKDIATLMDRLHQFGVHTIKPGRVIDEKDGGPVTDVVSAGLAALTDSATNPLQDYNNNFRRLQRRCQLPVLVPTGAASPPPPLVPEQVHVAAAAVNGTDQDSNSLASPTAEPNGDESEPDLDLEDAEDVQDVIEFTFDTAEDVALDMDDMGLISEPEDRNDDDRDNFDF